MSLWRIIKKLILFDLLFNLLAGKSKDYDRSHSRCDSNGNIDHDDYISHRTTYPLNSDLYDKSLCHGENGGYNYNSCYYDDCDAFGSREIDDYYDDVSDIYNEECDYDGDGW
jgi:hypothetical protein